FFVFIFCLLALGAINIISAKAATCSNLTDAQAQCYLDRYADLRNAFGANNISAAKQHWLNHGCPSSSHVESRDASCSVPNALTSAQAQCYLNRYSDLKAAFGSTNISRAKQHWIEFGSRENRNASCSGASTTPTPTPSASASPTPTPTTSPSSGSLTITTTSLPDGIYNQSYVAFIDATGGTSGDYTWTITGLPNGIVKEAMRTLSNTIANIPGIYITGKPSEAGTFNVKITVKSGTQTAIKNLAFSIVTKTGFIIDPEEDFCGNSVCEAEYNETQMSCPNDCGAATTACSDNPSAWYLNRYPDVKANGGDARIHYCAFGKGEKRENCFDTNICVPSSDGQSWIYKWARRCGFLGGCWPM
ncbi:hypothetical protein KJ665_02310, partial [Patescibacteria group bacterium]|nr:hypothetical protein [Patescibacteria group bacterium]